MKDNPIKHITLATKFSTMKFPSFLVFCFLSLVNAFAQKKQSTKSEFYCSPCDCKNDGKIFYQPGKCTVCRMRLLEVGAFNYSSPTISANNIIVYKSSKPDNVGRLFYKNLTSPGESKLIGKGSMPQILGNGESIVFEGEKNNMFLYSILRDTILTISSGINLPGIQSPSWNSSNRIIFTAGEFPQLGIYQLNIEDSKLEPLITGEGMRFGCKASPDGKKIAYRCSKIKPDSTREKGIAIYDLDTRTEKFITNIGEYCTWSPDGKTLAFHWKGTENFAIYVVNADGSDLKMIADHKEGDSELPCWSADGKKIYFQTNRRNKWEIWTMNTDGSNQQALILE